jgi:DNA polymerase III, delta subunit
MTPEQAAAELAGRLAPATLVLGRGSWWLASEAACPEWMVRDSLDAAGAREVRSEAYLMPPGRERVYLLRLDSASERVQNILLKVLEEPPPGTRFVLSSAVQLLPTVVSRCRVLALGSVSAGEPAADDRDKASVGTAVRAARSGQAGLLSQAVRDWKPAHARLLSAWAAEAASGRWYLFSPDFAPGVSPGQALRLLSALSRWAGTRTGAIAALDQVFREE